MQMRKSDDIIDCSTKTIKYWAELISPEILRDLQTWHQKCTSQKQQNDSCHAVAMTTVMPLTLF